MITVSAFTLMKLPSPTGFEERQVVLDVLRRGFWVGGHRG